MGPRLGLDGSGKRKPLASTGLRTRSLLSLYTDYDVKALCDVTWSFKFHRRLGGNSFLAIHVDQWPTVTVL